MSKQRLIAVYLFRAAMWRDYAKQWDNPYTKPWMEKVFMVTRRDCLDAAWHNVRKAKELNGT